MKEQGALFGQRVQHLLSVSLNDADVSQDHIYTFSNSTYQALESLSRGGDYEATRFIAWNADNVNYDRGRWLFSLIEDIKSDIYAKKITPSPQLLKVMGLYEAMHIRNIANRDMLNLMQSNLQFFLRYADLSNELKRRFYYDNVVLPEENWSQPFIDALRQNKELIGSTDITLDNKPQKPYVSNWLHDFDLANTTTANDKSAFNLVKYFNQSANAKSLKEDERQKIALILKLYQWLLFPSASEAEVDAYEAQDLENSPAYLELIQSAPLSISSAESEPVAPVERQDRPPQPPRQPAPVQDIVRKRPDPSVPAPELRTQRDASVIVERPVPTPLKPKPAMPPLAPEPKVASPSNPSLNVQDLLRRRDMSASDGSGLVLGQKSNVEVDEIGQRLQAERVKRTNSIDKKLEALKSRKGGDGGGDGE